MFILGITGNSGAGKSTVSKILAENGAFIIDADAIARQVLEPDGLAFDETVDFFGEEILYETGEIDRSKLAAEAFKDRAKLDELNRITHKYVIEQMDIEMERIIDEGKYRFICLDVPLLFESGIDKKCNAVWVVDAPYEKKIERIILRDNLSREKAEVRLGKQTDSSVLKSKAGFVIENDCPYEQLYQKVLDGLDALGEY